MTLTRGTNCGFVKVAPTVIPSGAATEPIDGFSWAFKDVSASNAFKVTEIGWYTSSSSEEANFEVGIYEHDAINDEPGTLIGSNKVNAKGTTSGWKTATVDIIIQPNTIYWIAVQIDATATATNGDYTTDTESKRNWVDGSLTLPDPDWGASGATLGRLFSFYAIYDYTKSGTIKIGTGGKSSRFIRTNYPNEEGLTAGTQKQTGRQINLIPEEGSNVTSNERVGIT